MSLAAAEQALAAGDLAAAVQAAMAAIRAQPGDARLRAFLFELSCLSGDLDRAERALGVLEGLEKATVVMTVEYAAAIAAERTRRAVFAGDLAPDVFGGARPWTDALAEALRLEASGAAQEAADARARALDAAEAEPGEIVSAAPGAEPAAARFDWAADADTRLGPVLETVLNGAYRWIPFQEIAELTVEPPADLKDLVWTVGLLTIREGGQWPVLIPTRYPGSESAGDPALALARKTEFRELAGGHAAGLGQRLIAHGEQDAPILELRRLGFDAGADAVAALAQDG